MTHLEEELKKWKESGKQLIGCFSAASNITGILLDTDSITTCLHRYDALAFWDYATAGPYVKIDMNPVTSTSGLAHKDAIFLSPHKFVGGVETPGVLIAKKKLFRNPVPTDGGGGGSVFFVTRESHRYLQQIEMREEGGTPSIVGAIRAGMVFQLKEAVGADLIMQMEHELCKKALDAWKTCKNLVLLGNTSLKRLPIFSFLIRHPVTKQFLHHNFICAVLNDVFGIQARGGCACAGPYAQDLLGIDENLAKEIESLLLEDSRLDRTHLRRYQEYSEKEILRPGFARINLPYFMSDEAVEFVISSVAMVANEGWKLLPQYMFNPETGEWKQRYHQVFRDRRWLGSISYATGKLAYPKPPVPKNKGRSPENYQDCSNLATEIFNSKMNVDLPDQSLLFDKKAESLRWFILPSEAVQIQNDPSHSITNTMPFNPPHHPDDTTLHQQKEGIAKVERESVVELCHLGPDDSKEDVQKTPLEVDQKTPSLEEKSEYLSDHHISSSTKDFVLAAGVSDCKEKISKMSLETKEDITSVQHIYGLVQDNDVQMRTSHSADETLKSDDTHSAINGELEKEKISQKCTSSDHLPLTVGKCLSYQPHSNLDIENSHFRHPENGHCDLPTGGNTEVYNCSCDKFESSRKNKQSESAKETTCTKDIKDTSVTSCPLIKRKPPKPKHKFQKQNNKKKKEVDGTPRFYPPPKSIFKPTTEALEEYDMIHDGDKVLVCLSGGKDSLSLLHALKQYQYYAKKKNIAFELGAVTVDPQTSTYDPSPLKGYLSELRVPYFYEEQCIMEQAASLPECTSICSFCSRMKRGRIYAAARRENYNVLAMGQHLDDLAESFFMSVFHNGLMRTMKANYIVKEGDLRVIRPFVYVREKDLRDFAKEMRLPVIAENCPACFEAPKERHRTKQLLATQELLFPRLYQSLATAMKPLMSKRKTGLESSRRLVEEEDDDL
ncbi:uncharacterized protein [Antedon mediterranea]|uniref:uncharacterized protein n=1 Tax=Antedon mediterranea TaxID=105859 RepID=UPI003AF9DD99